MITISLLSEILKELKSHKPIDIFDRVVFNHNESLLDDNYDDALFCITRQYKAVAQLENLIAQFSHIRHHLMKFSVGDFAQEKGVEPDLPDALIDPYHYLEARIVHFTTTDSLPPQIDLYYDLLETLGNMHQDAILKDYNQDMTMLKAMVTRKRPFFEMLAMFSEGE